MNWRQLFATPADEEIDAPQAQSRAAEGALLVDVRQPDEYSAGHAPGAEPIPLGKLEQKLADLPRDREILFICHSGQRSGIAAEIAGKAGLRAKNVHGGMIAWSRHGLPIVRSR